MNNDDIFYSIIQELNFFNNYFYQQYLVDLENETVWNVEKHLNISFNLFIKENNLSQYLNKKQGFINGPNNIIIISPKSHPNYKLVLKINASLIYFQAQPKILLDDHFTLIYDENNLQQLVNKEANNNVHIIIFDFYTNQNLSNEDLDNKIKLLIKDTFQHIHSYFVHLDYNKYCLVIKNSSELELYKYALNLYDACLEIKNIYLEPKLFLVEYDQSVELNEFINKAKNHFNKLTFDKNTIIIKEKRL